MWYVISKKKGERSEAVKPKNNLKMEGQLDVSRKELATSGERVEATKPKDNLKLEGKLQGDISLVYDLKPKVLKIRIWGEGFFTL